MVTLDPTTHTYLDAENNSYQSVTRFISKFVPEFDFVNKSKQYAAKYGLDVEGVRESWRFKNKQSTDFGTLIHEDIENKLLGKIKDKDLRFKEAILQITEKVTREFNIGKYHHELTLWDKKYKIAGTSDLIIDNGKSFSVVDFKTNKQIKYTNDYEDKFLLKPVNHLPNGEYFKYALQLSFYAYLYKQQNKGILDRLCFYWLKRKKNSYEDLTNCEWIRYNVPYLEEEVKSLLEYER